MVTLIQRFGSALNLNVHLHMIILDGVYTLEGNRPRFHQVNAPDRQHLEKLLNRIVARVMRRLVKDGLLIPDQDQPWLDLQETDTLDTLNAASTRYRGRQNPHLEEPRPAALEHLTEALHGGQRRLFIERCRRLPAAPAPTP